MEGQPRVAHLVIALDHGGLERCALLWTQGRNRRAPGSTGVICLDRPGPLATLLPGDSVTCLAANRNRFAWDRSAVSRLRRHLRERDIRILHSHNTAARFYAALAVRHLPVRHLYTDHGTNRHLTGWSNRLRTAFMRRHTHCYAAVSEPAARALLATGQTTPDALHLVSNGIPERTGPTHDLRQELGLPPDAFVLGFAGRLAPEKGLDRLLQVFPALPPDIHLVIIGDGPAATGLKWQCESLAGAGRIHFAGARMEARACLPAFDLFVLPSLSEGLPLALLEAMAEGVPVAATATGQCAQVLDGGALGLLLPPDAHTWPPLLAAERQAIRAGERAARCAAAQRRIAGTFSLDQTLDHYETLYRSLDSAL